MVAFVERPSPSHDARLETEPIDILLLHYTGMPTAAAALERMCDPAARVSAHYCIDEDGTVYRLVPEERRAWHAGVSSWAGTTAVNGRSIGIELVNPGHEFGYRAYPKPQMQALIALAAELCARHRIPPARILGHSDVAPLRKRDPGELFDWPGLAAAGIGLWPEDAADPVELPPIAEVQRRLRDYGYDVPVNGAPDRQTRAVIAAFQRHFRPEVVTGLIDGGTVARLEALLALLDGPVARS
jgi:N-acetylmuramoyl-L-alanine amidase